MGAIPDSLGLAIDGTIALTKVKAGTNTDANIELSRDECRALLSLVNLVRKKDDEHQHYTSTYCIHEDHNSCRLTCKVCSERCRCRCHAR